MFPARAGMNRVVICVFRVSQRVPRTRGDEPPDIRSLLQQPQVFPARAGMNRRLANELPHRHRVPRTRGDEPDLSDLFPPRVPCSPHARG